MLFNGAGPEVTVEPCGAPGLVLTPVGPSQDLEDSVVVAQPLPGETRSWG